MEGDCLTELVTKVNSEEALVKATETSSVRRKQRNRVKQDKKSNKKVLFFAGFQMAEISNGVHVSDGNPGSDGTSCTEIQSNSENVKTAEDASLEDEYVDDLLDYYEDYEVSNRKSTSCRANSSPRASGNNTKPTRGHPSGLMKVAKENKASRRVWNVAHNCTAQKENIGKRLEDEGIKKFGFDIYERRAEKFSSSTKRKSYQRSKTHNDCSTKSSRRLRKNEDHPAALKYELKSSNVPQDAGSHFDKMIDLQHRDLTPEDYELLLLLDESVAPKTVSENLLQSLVVMTAEVAETIGELCSICMELYHASHSVKKLPCSHIFHELCIDMWLKNSSLNCPLDGLAVEVT